MSKNDLYTSTLVVAALPSAVRTTGTVNGTTVDLGVFANDFRTALFVISAGTITDGTHVFKLQDSPDGTVWTDVDAKHVQGGARCRWWPPTATRLTRWATSPVNSSSCVWV